MVSATRGPDILIDDKGLSTLGTKYTPAGGARQNESFFDFRQ